MKLLVLFASIIFLSSCAKFIPNEIENGKLLGVMPMKRGKATYETTVRVSASREDIFRQSRRWTAFHIKTSAAALSLSDNLIGDVIVNGTFKGQVIKSDKTNIIMPTVNYAASIESYEGSYRVTLTNFWYEIAATNVYPVELRSAGLSKKAAKQQLMVIQEAAEELLADLASFIPEELQSAPIQANK